MRIELVVNLVFEASSAANFLSPYIYDYHFGPSSPNKQNLSHDNNLLSWSKLHNKSYTGRSLYQLRDGATLKQCVYSAYYASI